MTSSTPSVVLRPKGFTLIEIMIVVAIIGILATIALPSYLQYLREGRRIDATAALMSIESAQEKHRVSNTSYTTDLTGALGISTTSPEGHYTLAVTSANATSYTATATATGGQTSDTGCTTITLSMSAGATTKTPADCWKK